MQKILFVTMGTPYPITSGRQIRTHSFVQALAQDNELYLLYQTWDGLEKDDLSDFFKYFKKVQKVVFNRVKPDEQCSLAKRFMNKYKLLYGLVSLKSWQLYDYNLNFERAILNITEGEKVDMVFCRYMDTAKYLIRLRNQLHAKVIVDLDDIEPVKLHRTLKTTRKFGTYGYFRHVVNNWLYLLNHKKLKVVDAVTVCSHNDAAYVQDKKWCRSVHVIPNSIHVRNYATVEPFRRELLHAKAFLCCGHLGYSPNINGLQWFLDYVWPVVLQKEPQAKLLMVGKNPAPSLKTYVDDKSVFLYPNVASILPYYQHISAAIVPLHVGGGTRIKILEAFAARRPVIATTIGAEGLGVTDRRHCLIADSPEDFARACLEIVHDAALAQKLVEEGYRFVTAHYDFSGVAKMIQQVFRSKAKEQTTCLPQCLMSES
jgi:glycosyltransferase involved in cell wall biosynthesis